MKKGGVYHISSFLHYYIKIFIILSIICSAHDAFGVRLTHLRFLFEIQHDFKQPSDVAVSEKGYIYVVDGVNNRIQVFNQEGKYLYAFGGKGRAPGQFRYPLGIDIDQSGNVYIADSGNHRVQVFDSHGGFLYQISVLSKGLKPSDPTDVAVDEQGKRIYVADNDNHTILVYALESHEYMMNIGSPGTGKREFRYPFHLALDAYSYLYIVDVINTRVQVMNQEGKFVMYVGGWGVEKGEFFRPKGVAIDRKNRIMVSDSYMGVIQTFRSTGEFYSVLGDASRKKIMKFKTPVGIYIDSKNRLYVTEMFAERVTVYEILGDHE